MQGGVLRVDDEKPHHPHRHLRHFVGMRVVHEGPALHEIELVDEGLAGRDAGWVRPVDAVHAARQDHAVPVDGGVLGQLVGDEDAHAVAFDGLDGGARRLAVIAPQIGSHAGRHLALDGLGHKVELLDVAVHPVRQRPAVQRYDGLVVRPALRQERRLHVRRFHQGGFGQPHGGGLGPGGRASQKRAAAE